MEQVIQVIILSLVVAYSIFATFPVAFKRISSRAIQFLMGTSLGILVYLLMDLFSSTYPLQAGSIQLSLLFIIPFLLSYLGFHWFSSIRLSNTTPENYAEAISFIVTMGIGLQNLTEGLAIGGSLRLGLSTVVLPLVIGLSLQNATEGFPIVSPFLRQGNPKGGRFLFYMYLLAGTPVVVGSLFSFYTASQALVILFNSIAMGGILFVALEIYKGMIRQHTNSHRNLSEIGIAVGLALTFAVNLLP